MVVARAGGAGADEVAGFANEAMKSSISISCCGAGGGGELDIVEENVEGGVY